MTHPNAPLSAQRARIDAERRTLARLTLNEIVELARDACTSAHTIHLDIEPHTTSFTMTAIECAHDAVCADRLDNATARELVLDLDLSWDLADHGLAVAGEKARVRVSVALAAAAGIALPATERTTLPARDAVVGDFTLRLGEHLRVPVYVDAAEPSFAAAHVPAVLAEAGARGLSATWADDSTVILHDENTCEVSVWSDDAQELWPVEPLLLALGMDEALDSRTV